ncbi:MAG: hypothetical protein ABF856_15620, partial [Acetobacter aceti]
PAAVLNSDSQSENRSHFWLRQDTVKSKENGSRPKPLGPIPPLPGAHLAHPTRPKTTRFFSP